MRELLCRATNSASNTSYNGSAGILGDEVYFAMHTDAAFCAPAFINLAESVNLLGEWDLNRERSK